MDETASRAAPASIGAELPPRAGARRDGLAAAAFVLPLAAIFAAFYLWPAASTIASSFFRWGLLNPWRATRPNDWDFVALHNYAATLTDHDFWNAAVNTAIWLVVFPLLVTGFSLAISILIWWAGRGSVLFRTVFILPMTISLTAAGVIWTFVYNPDADLGVLNAVLGAVGLGGSHQWLSDLGGVGIGSIQIRFVNLSLVVAAFWAFAGFGVITFTAGLTSISQDLVEAAIVDGARPRHVARYVLLPALRRPLVIVAVVSVIFALRIFDVVYVMTQGGPAQDTEVLALLLWQEAFAFLDTPAGGLATAIAVLLSIVLLAGGYPYLRGLAKGARR
jgi:ABC-type sugar transport system permease subunit